MEASAPAQAVKPPKWYNWIRKLEARIPEASPWRKIGRVSKWAVPISSAIAFTIASLAAPFPSVVGFLFWLLVGGGPPAAVSVALSKGFKHAAALRKISELEQQTAVVSPGDSELRQKINDLRDEKRELLDRQGELERALGEVQRMPARDTRVAFDGRHVLIDLIGKGGFAVALRVFDTKIGGNEGMQVWKFPLDSTLVLMDQYDREAAKQGIEGGWVERYLARFEKGEAKTMMSINHPNVVRIFTLDYVDRATYERLTEGSLKAMANPPRELPYIAMEYVPYGTLQKRIELQRKKGWVNLPMDEVVRIGISSGRALRDVHAKQVIHRDLKPDNIFYDEITGEIKIGDFGIAKIGGMKTQHTTQGPKGTPYYMSPEQVRDEPDLDWRTDEYALGATLYELLAGQPPFGYIGEKETDAAYLAKILIADKVPNVGEKVQVPGTLASIITRMLALDKNMRFRSDEEYVRALMGVDLTGGLETDATVVGARIVGGRVVKGK